ncbi:MAG: Zn-ribbon domain-containing OB-fold protein [Thermoproteota archaeon]|nr:Zn-ribbon domain-containing OB-fold protein [Thermoproteota archaeon]
MPPRWCTFTGGLKVVENFPFTIEQFYKFIGQGKLMAAKCRKCGALLFPPKPVCTECYSKDLKWVELGKSGKLLTYTVIYVAPPQFQPMTPYAVGIVKLEGGPKIPGMIRGVHPEKIRVGMNLTVDFDENLPSGWPQWPRYYFKPA